MPDSITYRLESIDDTSYDCTVLFNEPEYITLSQNATHRFIAEKEGKVLAYINMLIAEENCFVGKNATFGYLEYFDTPQFEKTEGLLEAWLKKLMELRIRKILWKLFPPFYNQEIHTKTVQSLLNFGFIIEGSAENFYLSSKFNFENSLTNDAHRRLKKSLNSGHRLKVNESFRIDDFYSHLEKWRKHRGIELNIAKDALDRQIEALKDRYVLFTLHDNNKLIAFVIGVKVSGRVLYQYLTAHDPDYSNYSPVILLISTMHDYAARFGFEYLDLGIASEMNGDENYGLIRFKEKMGARSSIKLNLIRELK